jgi:hypothetical protein
MSARAQVSWEIDDDMPRNHGELFLFQFEEPHHRSLRQWVTAGHDHYQRLRIDWMNADTTTPDRKIHNCDIQLSPMQAQQQF